MPKDDPARAARLTEALRANLKRRKAQAREAEAAPADSVAAHRPKKDSKPEKPE